MVLCIVQQLDHQLLNVFVSKIIEMLITKFSVRFQLECQFLDPEQISAFM